MIQTILLNNFIVVATLFVLSKTFKVWHEIKHHKVAPEKQVIVYDNLHSHHVDEAGHGVEELEEGHGHSHGSWIWGSRSLQEPTTTEQEYEDYSSNRVVRSTRGRGRRRKRHNIRTS